MAGDRSVTVRLEADVNKFISGMQSAVGAAKKAASGVSSAWSSMQKQQQAQEQSWNTLSNGMLKAGTIAASAVGAVAAAAISWQSDFAGVTKTVDGTTAQMGELEDQLRSMAREMPATHTEIAAVAAAAGQLGIAREDVAAFSETMIQLGATTNLSADDAATSLAQFMNIMGTSASNVDRLGATLVQLGNNGASTEAEIMQLSQRLAGAGAQMNMTEADVMGIANAMASVGVTAEAGGTAMSTTFKQIDAAVRSGGEELQTYAKVSGMTAVEFAQAWGTDAASATASFVEGLGRMRASGEDVNGVLAALGINNERQLDVLIRLASATKNAGAANDLLRDSLEMGSDAYVANTALTDEYAKRVETAKSQITIAWNQIKDASISAGEATLPVISGVANAVGALATAVGDLPAPVLAAGTSLAGIGAMAALSVGGLMKGVAALNEYRSAFDALPTRWQSAANAGRRLIATAAMVGAAMSLLSTAGTAWQASMDSQRLSTEGMTTALNEWGATGNVAAMEDSWTRTLAGASYATKDMTTALRMLNEDAGGFTGWIDRSVMGLVGMKGNLTMAEEEMTKMDTALAGLDPTAASTGTTMMLVAAKFKEAGYSADEIAGRLPQVTNQFRQMAQEVGVASISNEDMVRWMQGIEPASVTAAKALAELGYAHVDAGASAAQQAAALQSLLSIQSQMAAEVLNASNSEIAYASALDKAAEAAKESGIEVDANTGKINVFANEASRNAQQALNNMVAAYYKQVDAAVASGASMEEVGAMTQRTREDFIAAAGAMGIGEEAANRLADGLGLIPGQVTTDVSVNGVDAAVSQVEMMKGMIETFPPEVQSTIKSAWDGAAYAVAAESIASLPPEKQAMIMSAWESGGYDSAVASLADVNPETRAAIISAWDAAGYNAAVGALNSLQNKTVYIDTIYRSLDQRVAYNIGQPGRAAGGSIWGPGTSTSDSIPAWLSNGEFVIRTAAAERLGYGVLDYINRWGQLPQQGYASGGQVAPLSRQLAQSAAPVINLTMPSADDIARATSVRPIQLAVYLDSRQIAAGQRAYNRGLN